jgi:hypothetical protein
MLSQNIDSADSLMHKKFPEIGNFFAVITLVFLCESAKMNPMFLVIKHMNRR